jgi:hypothetical protein
VAGASDSPSSELLAAWLGLVLKAPVRRVKTAAGSGVVSVRLERKSGPIDLVRPDGSVATLSQPGQPDRRISLKRRGLAECLADELRRLDDDDIYAETLTKGLRTLSSVRQTASEAAAKGEAPSTEKSRRLATKLARTASSQQAAEMVVAPLPPDEGDTAAVKKATARKRAGAPTAREAEVAQRPKRGTKKSVAKAAEESADPRSAAKETEGAPA